MQHTSSVSFITRIRKTHTARCSVRSDLRLLARFELGRLHNALPTGERVLPDVALTHPAEQSLVDKEARDRTERHVLRMLRSRARKKHALSSHRAECRSIALRCLTMHQMPERAAPSELYVLLSGGKTACVTPADSSKSASWTLPPSFRTAASKPDNS